MGATSGPGTAYPSGAPAFTLIFSGVHVTRSLVVCVCFVDRCLSFCAFFFAIVLSVHGFTDSDYPFGIFKLFFLSPINRLNVHWSLPFSLMCFGVCEWSEEWVVLIKLDMMLTCTVKQMKPNVGCGFISNNRCNTAGYVRYINCHSLASILVH